MAASQFYYVRQKTYPRIQIRTIRELLDEHGIEYPQAPVDVTFRKAKWVTSQISQLEVERQ